ncbi:MAG: HU family DNA-binding protein [bacterium]
MYYSELVDKMAEEWDMKRTEARDLVDHFFTSIGNVLKEDERLELRGFGVFEVRDRDSHTGRIPGEDVEMEVPARKVPAFKASKKIKEVLRELDISEHKELSPADD